MERRFLIPRHIFMLWEHQGSWENQIFREILKLIKILWLLFFPKSFLLWGYWSICLHVLWNQKNSVRQINVQILATRVEFSGYLLFFVWSITMPKKPTVNRVKPTSYKVVRDSFFFSFCFVRTVLCFAFIFNSANAQFNNRLGFLSVIGS